MCVCVCVWCVCVCVCLKTYYSNNRIIFITVALRYTLRRFEIQTSLRRFEGTLLRFKQPSTIRGYAFAIQTAFDYSNKPSTIRTSLRRFEPSTIRTSLRRFEPSTIQTSLSNKPSAIRAFDDSNKPSATRTSLRRFEPSTIQTSLRRFDGAFDDSCGCFC